MGVLRLPPDAFADSGRSLTRAAVAGGRRMISEGADIVEICCTPPQPGHPVATPPTIGTGSPRQAHQVAGVAEALAGDVRVAIATGSPELAAAAVTAGATLICDRSMVPSTVGDRAAEPPAPAEAAREQLVGVASENGAGWVAVEMATPGASPAGEANGRRPGGSPIVAETLEALEAQVGHLSAAGLREIYVDPGIGCVRATAEDLDLLGGLERLAALGHPLVVGTGDGLLIDELHAAAGASRPPESGAPGDRCADRLEGALVVAVWAMLAGAAVLRTHHVAATVQAARVVGAKQPVGTP